MSYYSTQRLWKNESQNTIVFNWKELLEEWNESLNMSPYIQTIIDNIKATSDPDSEYSYPLEHFLKYLNWEKDGLTWFLYEVVTMRYMWGESRLDYVKELLERPEIKLDEGFPVFPGSPRNYRTVRRFLKDSLTEDELEYLEMPSPPPVTPSTPPRQIRPVDATAPPPAPRKQELVYQDILIFLQRADKNGKSQPDDDIRIKRKGNLLYEIVYYNGVNDKHEKFTMQEYADVMYYVKNILKLNRIDKEAFQYIQFTFPGAPDVLLDGDTNVEERDLIYDALERTLKNWPVVV